MQKKYSVSIRKIFNILFFLFVIIISSTPVIAKPTVLSLKNEDIRSVIDTVSEATNKNFIVDPRVRGRVTVVSSERLDKEQLYQVFLAILDVHGFTAVPSEAGVIKILPEADAKHSGVPTKGKGEEFITQVIDVEHISARRIVPVLRPLVSRRGHLAAHAKTNILIIADRMSNITRLVRIIRKIDEPTGSSIEMIPLRHASASEVVRVLTSLQRNKKRKRKTSSITDAPTLVADERSNTILMGGNKSGRLGMRTLIAHLDIPSETSGKAHVIFLRYAKAKALAKVLSGVSEIKLKNKNKRRSRRRKVTKIFDIQADESSNALIITTSIDIYRSLKDVVKKLDIPRDQVIIEAIVAEVSVNSSEELGVQWLANRSEGGMEVIGVSNFGLPLLGGIGVSNTSGQGEGTLSDISNALGAGLTLGVEPIDGKIFDFGGLLHALEATGSTNLLSTPSILTLDNQEAEIFVGSEVSVPTGSYSQTGTNTGNPFTTFKPKQVGIQLKVKPQISSGNAIRLELDQSIEAIAAGDAGAANLVTTQRTIETTVMVDDGQVIVLGGLVADTESTIVQKVPLLGDIPIIGALFRYEREVEDKKNLLLFLKPRILRNAKQATGYANSRYEWMRKKQIETRGRNSDTVLKKLAPIVPDIDVLLDIQ